MRSNWVAMGAGVLLAVVVAALVPHGTDDKDAPSCRMDELINQGFDSGPPGLDRRPLWQQWIDPAYWWFERCPQMPSHLTPERLHGGIM